VSETDETGKGIIDRIGMLSPERRALLELRLRQKGLSVSDTEITDGMEVSNGTNEAESAPIGKEIVTRTASGKRQKGMSFSLFFFSGYGETLSNQKYYLVLESGRFADQHGFSAVWTPERHFKPFGGLYPNPAVLAASLAVLTRRVQLRAGSVVLPLHNPISVVEDWSVVDNLSCGRVGLAFASGWHPDDFVLSPDSYLNRRERMRDGITTVKRLWRGDCIRLRNGTDNEVEVKTLPRPLQRELPIWITANSSETFLVAGELGANVLTGLIEQSIEECAEKIEIYRRSLERHGHDPESGQVSVMLHTYVDESTAKVLKKVRRPFCAYLRSFLQMSEKQLKGGRDAAFINNLTEDDQESLLNHAFERYYNSRALFGSPTDCKKMVDTLGGIGVNEIACLLDFGLDEEAILSGLRHLDALRESYTTNG
jgi:natural product biosynthesis luciferase-like monooxygenase protein